MESVMLLIELELLTSLLQSREGIMFKAKELELLNYLNYTTTIQTVIRILEKMLLKKHLKNIMKNNYK